jgi:hypothetical protein
MVPARENNQPGERKRVKRGAISVKRVVYIQKSGRRLKFPEPLPDSLFLSTKVRG